MPYKYPTNIFDAIRQERQDFLYNYIELVDGLTFNQYAVVKKIHKYYNNWHVDGSYETINGVTRKKVFWNIGKRRCTIASKQIDIDTKDFLLISENQATEWNVFLLEKELKAYLKKDKYGIILNQVSDELPLYGTVVLRKTKDGAEVCDLRYLMCDQAAESLKKSRYTILKHLLTPQEMRGMKDWDNVQEAIDKFAQHSFKSYETSGQLNIQHGTPYVEVYERFAEVPRSYLENDGTLAGDESEADNDYVLARFIVAGVDNKIYTPSSQDQQTYYYDKGIILFQEQIDELPFKECHYRKTRGRWLGIGVMEDTFEDQRMVNKVKDQEDKAGELASLILFQTAQDMVAKNVLTDVDNGEILKAAAPITRLDNQNKAFGEMLKMAEAYENHSDLATFSSDYVAGKPAAPQATLGAVKAQLQMTSSVHDYFKQNYGLFLEDFIKDLVFPELEKKIMKPHTFRFTGDLMEMQKLRERVVDGYLRQQILKTGDIPTQDEYTALKQKYIKLYQKNGAHLWIETEKDFFKNIDYEVSLEVTGEHKDVQTWINNINTVFGIVSRNPVLMQNPLLKRLLYKMLSAMGMSISELENAEAEITQEVFDLMIKQGIHRSVMMRVNMDDNNPEDWSKAMEAGGAGDPPQNAGQPHKQLNNGQEQ